METHKLCSWEYLMKGFMGGFNDVRWGGVGWGGVGGVG